MQATKPRPRSRRAARPAARFSSVEALIEYRRTRDRRLRDQIVAAHVRLAYSAAHRFRGRGAEVDDLAQVALLALVEAVDRFEPERGIAFSTYAMSTIQGTLKHHLRDRTWAVRPPRSVLERFLAVSASSEQLTNELRRRPSTEEIAERVGCSAEQVREALAVGAARFTAGPITLDTDEPPVDIGAADRVLDRVESRIVVDSLLSHLCARDRAIVEMRFYDELLQHSIAEHFGVSQMQISRVLARSLAELRDTADEALAG
jgi:RNA polymerase sigma-B factor